MIQTDLITGKFIASDILMFLRYWSKIEARKFLLLSRIDFFLVTIFIDLLENNIAIVFIDLLENNIAIVFIDLLEYS